MKLPILAVLLGVASLHAAPNALDEISIRAASESKGEAFAEYLKATTSLEPEARLAALWRAGLMARNNKEKEAVLAEAGTIPLPGARMLVSLYHHDDDLRDAVNKATKALNVLMPPPKKDEEDKGAATDPYKTPALTETWTDPLGVSGRWTADGSTLDLVAYPMGNFQGILTNPETGNRIKLIGIKDGEKVNLYGEGASGTASKSEVVLKLHGKMDKPVTFTRTGVGKTSTFPKPADAQTLFDGSNLDAFEKTSWQVLPEGVLQSTPRTGNLKTKGKYGDARLYLEFRTPLNPEAVGQRRSNSGVIIMGAYEVQLLDSFGLEAKPNDCGSIYSVAAPKVNMSAPPLEWQSYLIEFRAPRFDESGKKTENANISVWHNGELIQDKVEVPRLTGASPNKPSPRPEPSKPEALIIQDHGNSLQYRNMWIEPL